MSERPLVIVNPAARNGAVGRQWEQLAAQVAALGIDAETIRTERAGHATEIVRAALRDGPRLVVAVGGDGTVNEVVNGILERGTQPDQPMLAVVPGGSTNVFSRALGRSRDPVEATAEILDSLRAGQTRLISLGTASASGPEGWSAPRWFVFATGLGFDAEVIERVEARRAAGRRSTGALYVREATRAFLLGRDRRHPAVSLQIPGSPPSRALFLCLVSNVSPWTYLGDRPVNPSPEASFDSGLDVFAMGRVGPLRMISTLGRTLTAGAAPRGRRVFRWHDVDQLTLTADRPLGWQADGDHLGLASALRIQHVPGALRVVA
jgi:diacylglycerol kinase family enzyme